MKSRLLLASLCAACLSLTVWAAEEVTPSQTVIDLPQIGDPADLALSPAEEKTIGARVMAELYRGNYVLEDAEIAEYLAAVTWKLAGASQGKPPQINVMTIADPRINAFALPGGYIGVNTGLLVASNSESELAAVLGHELAHVTQRHIARSQQGNEVATIATWAAVLAAIIAGSANPEIVIGALSLGQAATYQRQVSYTRGHEQEADRIGIQTLAAAGYDPQAMASFFVRLEQQARLYGNGLPEILRTHPLNTSRISEARERADVLPRKAVNDTIDFSLMQARARVLEADSASEAAEYFAGQLDAGRDSPAFRYGYALALSGRGQYAEAEEQLNVALAQHPRQANLNLLKGRLEQSRGKSDQALATLSRTLANYPRYAPAIFTYADSLITLDKAEQARQVLLTHEQALGTRLQTWRLLADAARETRNLSEASYNMGVYLFLRGDAGGALGHLDAGLRMSTLNTQERARMQAKRDEIRETLPKNWRPPNSNRRS